MEKQISKTNKYNWEVSCPGKVLIIGGYAILDEKNQGYLIFKSFII